MSMSLISSRVVVNNFLIYLATCYYYYLLKDDGFLSDSGMLGLKEKI